MEEKVIEIRVHVPKIHLSPRVWKWGLAGLLVLALAENPATESVTLSTYYPAPAGAYNNMVTIGNTWLARDPQSGGTPSFVEMGSNLGVPPNVKLDVTGGNVGIGNANNGGYPPQPIDPTFGGVAGSGNGNLLGIAAQDNSTALVIGNTSGAPRFALNPQSNGGWQMSDYGSGGWQSGLSEWNGSVTTQKALSVGPFTTNPSDQSYIHVNANNACSPMGPGQDNAMCPGGWYATWTPGIYVETPNGYSGPGWAHDRYALYALDPADGQWLNFNIDCSAGWGTLQIQAAFPHSSPGLTEVCVAGEGLFGGNGNNRWWCCPK